MYLFRSKVGTFCICWDGIRWYLAVNGDVLDVYDSPIAAADNVYLHVTGYMPWDRLDGIIDGPTDLSEWNFVEI